MQLNRKLLLEALSTVSAAISRKPSNPILADVLATTDGDNLQLVGTDTRSTITALVACVDAESFAVNAEELRSIVAGLSCDGIEINHRDGGKLEVRGGKSRFTLSADQPRYFPKLPKMPEKSSKVSASAFATALECVAYAASTDYTRPFLCAVEVVESQGSHLFVATDGHRLALVRAEVEGLSGSFTLDSRSVPAIIDILDCSESCRISVGDGMIHVTASDVSLSAKLCEGQFPPYEQVVPGKQPSPITVNREELIAALKRGSILRSSSESRTPTGRLIFGRSALTIERDEQGSSWQEVVNINGGKTLNIGCNLHYLAEAVEQVVADDVELHMSGDLDPIMVREPSGKQVAVVMPARL